MEIKNQNRFRLKPLANVGKFSLLFSSLLFSSLLLGQNEELPVPNKDVPQQEVELTPPSFGAIHLSVDEIIALNDIDGNIIAITENLKGSSNENLEIKERFLGKQFLIEKNKALKTKNGKNIDSKFKLYNSRNKYKNEVLVETISEGKSFNFSYVPNYLMVQKHSNVSDKEFRDYCSKFGYTVEENLNHEDIYLVKLNFESNNDYYSPSIATKNLISNPNIVYLIDMVSGDGQLSYDMNDPNFNAQWALHNTGQNGGLVDADIDAKEAWDIRWSTGDIIIGILDSGINKNLYELTSPNFVPPEFPNWTIGYNWGTNIWSGFGYDFHNNNNNPVDENGHGTAIAGIIGSAGNNLLGITGVAHRTKLMSLKIIGSDTNINSQNADIYNSRAVSAINWGISQSSNLKVINISLTLLKFNSILFNLINNNPQILFVCSAGNNNFNIDTYNFNNGSSINGFPLYAYYPARYSSNNIISVAASTSSDGKSAFSNYGQKHVDIFAPGEGITTLSHLSNTSLVSSNGTSASAALVAGSAGLLYAQYPGKSANFIKNRLLLNADLKQNLESSVPFGRRLNINNALRNPIHFYTEDGYDLGEGFIWMLNWDYMYTNGNGWIYHHYMGWLYSTSTDKNNIWLYDYTSNKWVWTTYDLFPVFILESPTGSGQFHTIEYLKNSSGVFTNPRSFHNHTTNQIQNNL